MQLDESWNEIRLNIDAVLVGAGRIHYAFVEWEPGAGLRICAFNGLQISAFYIAMEQLDHFSKIGDRSASVTENRDASLVWK